jgi:hypothetical protein
VIHRVDAELALGQAVEPIPADLAVDGIDEVLKVFLSYCSHRWPDYFEAALKDQPRRQARVETEGGSWLVTMAPEGVDVAAGSPNQEVDAVVSGAPDPLLRWLWARGGDQEIKADGDSAVVTALRGVLATATV